MKAFLVASSIALCACASESSDVSMTTTTSAEVGRRVPTTVAIERMTHAQCARAQACGAIEQRGIYWSADFCQESARAIRDEMAPPTCTTIDSWRLDACFEAIRLQSCQRVAENERAPADCRKAALCR